MKKPSRAVLGLALLVALGGLRDSRAHAQPDGRHPVKIGIKGDAPAFAIFATGESDEVIVYLPGLCGDTFAGLHAFPEEAAKRGTFLVVQGDKPCPDPARHSWGPDLTNIQKRIDVAVAAAEKARGKPLEKTHLTLLGYSQGALKAEQLVKRFPERYPRVAIMASPRAPTATSFPKDARAVLAVGALDRQDLMKDGFEALAGAGVKAKLLSFPDCGHGSYGPEGARVMDEAFAFLFADGT